MGRNSEARRTGKDMETSVMIVDDNQAIRDSVEMLFQTVGIQIVTADGGEACLMHLEQGFRGIILMDVMMPGMDGWDTIRQIVERGLYDGNIITMLTAKSEPDSKMDGLQIYVTDYITKPFDSMQLIETVSYLDTLRKG
jgi:DNA-binding response OmpR family regulator